MSSQESDLRRERPAPPLCLPCGLGSADDDVTQLERSVGLPPESVQGAAQAPARPTKIDKIERLSDLKEKGALTEEEFESAKAEVLGRD